MSIRFLFLSLVKMEYGSLHTISAFLQYQFSFYARSSSFSLELVFHLVTASSLLGCLGQQLFFFSCLGKNVTIFGKKFPRFRSQN